MFLRKYLHRIPVPYAAFITALISLFVLVATGALQGDLRYVNPEGIQFILEVIGVMMKDFVMASVVFGILVFLDSFFLRSKKHSS
jgi:branched-subunit amino acid transport protein